MSSDKPILTISVAASLLQLHPRTLMLYESAGFIKPHRTGTQRRLFSAKDLEDLQFVKYLTKDIGINLQGVKHLLESFALAEKEGVNLRKKIFPTFQPKSLL
jgi:MerR family transcriptional regulator, heat shock protein HspR